VDIEPLAIQRVEGKEMILASGRPIAALVRPGPDSRSGADSFGFELLSPTPVSELEARAMAYLIYRTLRKSGIRWALWRPNASRVAGASTAQIRIDAATDTTENTDAESNDVGERPNRAARMRRPGATRRTSTRLTKGSLAFPALAAAAVLAVGVAPFVTIPLAPFATVVLAGMGAGAVMLLRSRRLQ
jgi:hypothetical protein